MKKQGAVAVALCLVGWAASACGTTSSATATTALSGTTASSIAPSSTASGVNSAQTAATQRPYGYLAAGPHSVAYFSPFAGGQTSLYLTLESTTGLLQMVTYQIDFLISQHGANVVLHANTTAARTVFRKTLNGTLQNGQLVLEMPVSTLMPNTDFRSGSLSEYNAAVAAFQSQVRQAGAVYQQQQAQASAVAKTQSLARSLTTDAAALPKDVQGLQQSLSFQGVLAKAITDLAAEQAALNKTHQNEMATAALEAKSGMTPQAGSDARQVASDAAIVASDAAAVTSDQAELNTLLTGEQRALAALQSDYQSVQSLEQQLPNIQPPAGLPTAATVQTAIKQAESTAAAANQTMLQDAAQSQAMVTQATQYVQDVAHA